MMTKNLKFINPQVYSTTWIPVGKSNMEALNRFVGAHKRYTTPTEFGGTGQVDDMGSGTFTMEKEGVFLTPENYNSTRFLHAKIRETFNDSKAYGLSINKNGLAGLGIKVSGDFRSDQIKVITGKLAYKITDCIFPILNDQQRTLISCILQSDELASTHHKVQTFSLIISNSTELKETNSSDLFKNHSNTIEALTDWVVAHTTIDNCHIFMGMSAILCLGNPDDKLMKKLSSLQFLQSCNKASHHLHASIWSMRKQILNIRTSILKGNYKVLKHYNEKICVLNSILLRIKVFDKSLREETTEMAENWKDISVSDKQFHEKIKGNYSDEVDKSEDRNTTIEQLSEELSVLSNELENRLELILTRDSMTLNIILLIMTVLSVLGVAEVVGFTNEQWKIVAIVIIPFGLASFIYLKNFLKNFLRKL